MKEWELKGEALKRADALHYGSIVVDMSLTTNFAQPSPIINGENALERSRGIGGITAAHQTLVGSDNRTFRDALKQMNLLNRLISQNPDKVMLVTKSNDVEKAKAEGKIGLIMGFQGCDPIEDDWSNTLPVLYRMGARVMALTYNERNLLGYGCTEPKDYGLTAYGTQVVRAMNQMGIIIDLSHVGMQTSMDAIEMSEDPVLFTHSNVYAISPHVRNLPDEVIKAVAAKGGVIGAVTWEPITARPGKEGVLGDMLDHIDYIVNLVGVDHVGIGSDRNDCMRVMPILSDFEARYAYMIKGQKNRCPGLDGYDEVHDIINVTRGLVARGYSDEDIKKVLGGNFMRVARKVWDKV
ncbi:MAG: dipeptidase [Clostridiaceae bacterium]|jgi:membrane dipeptidase|nr:dipeptidase [Clostridiaceae bacterium]